MNKATRVLTMTGMALVAGATIGAGSASAAPATPAAPKTAAASQSAIQVKPFGFRDRVVGYYRSPAACLRAGRFGEFRGSWDSFRCVRVRGGWHRSTWALVVSYDSHRWLGNGHGFPGGFGNRNDRDWRGGDHRGNDRGDNDRDHRGNDRGDNDRDHHGDNDHHED